MPLDRPLCAASWPTVHPRCSRNSLTRAAIAAPSASSSAPADPAAACPSGSPSSSAAGRPTSCDIARRHLPTATGYAAGRSPGRSLTAVRAARSTRRALHGSRITTSARRHVRQTATGNRLYRVMIQGLLSVNRERCSGRRPGHLRARRARPKPGRPEDPTVRRAVSTELERFLATDGRDEAVARVRSEIDARGITYLSTSSPRSPAGSWARGCPRTTGSRSPGRASSWSTVDRQPVHRPARQLHRLRAGGVGAGRAARRGDVLPAAVGPEDRAGVLHAVPQPGGRGRPGGKLTSDCRGNLRRIHEAFERDTGCTCGSGPSRR